jgi:hypothetical protein
VKARRSASKATHIVVSSEIYSGGEGALTVKKKEDCRALDMKSNVRLQACDINSLTHHGPITRASEFTGSLAAPRFIGTILQLISESSVIALVKEWRAFETLGNDLY